MLKKSQLKLSPTKLSEHWWFYDDKKSIDIYCYIASVPTRSSGVANIKIPISILKEAVQRITAPRSEGK